MIPLPDPALHDSSHGILLRPWGTSPGDAEMLAAAWSDPVIVAETEPPEDRSVESAARWISGEAERRRRNLALDLVIADVSAGGRRGSASQVLGEVGVVNFDHAGRAEVGFWLTAEARGRGVATLAVGLVADWGLSARGLGCTQLWARTAPGNERAAGVLKRAGFRHLGEVTRRAIWARSA